MKHFDKRRLLPALLLLLILAGVACGEEPPANSVAPATLQAPTADLSIVPTTGAEPSVTPLPVVSFKGVEFLFDEDVLGAIGSMAHVPPAPPGREPVQPEHIEIKLNAHEAGEAPSLYVFPVAQYAALSTPAAEEIERLRAILQERPTGQVNDLPLLPMLEAVTSYQTEPSYLDFQNGSGISYLTRVDHDHSLSTDEIFFYTFQGLTDDDQFYVAAFVPLTTAGTGEQANGSAERAAKAAPSSNWVSQEASGNNSLADGIMLSLVIKSGEGFPSITLPNFLSAEGLIVAYDERFSGETVESYGPALVSGPEGDTQFVEGLPDIMTVEFGLSDAQHGHLEIQAVRDETGTLYPGLPKWQRDALAAAGDSQIWPTAEGESAAEAIQNVDFQNGGGMRWISEGAFYGESAPIYHFRGLTADQRYLVSLRHLLPNALEVPEALGYLDNVVRSIVVSPDAAQASSIPQNAADCENDAVFVSDVSIPDDTVIERGETFVKIWRVRNTGTCTWNPAYRVTYAMGNPLEWQEMALTAVVAPGEETDASVSIQSPEAPGIYEASWQLMDESGNHFGSTLDLRFEAPRPATDIPGYGVVEGSIKYPANGNPAVDIYFLRTDGSERYVMQTEQGWTHYSNAIPAGEYFVFSRVAGDSSDSGGGYTAAVVCGLHSDCQDHSLVAVEVQEGRATRDINVLDWYAPAGTFPLPEANEPESAEATKSP